MRHLVVQPTYDPGKTAKGSHYEHTLLRHFVEQGVALANGKHDVRFTTDGEP